VFDFDNATADPVAVYLSVSRSQWLLGYTEPGRHARLRLPDYFVGPGHPGVTVIVLPVGAARSGVVAQDDPGAICSEVVPNDELSSMHWTLRGRRLISFAPPRSHEAANVPR
jgi:hypothetical protein